MTKLAENNPQSTANIADDRVLGNVISNREKAIEWWNEVKCENTSDYCTLICNRVFFKKNINTLTGSEIEKLWRFYNVT